MLVRRKSIPRQAHVEFVELAFDLEESLVNRAGSSKIRTRAYEDVTRAIWRLWAQAHKPASLPTFGFDGAWAFDFGNGP